jgi:competence protein ComEC
MTIQKNNQNIRKTNFYSRLFLLLVGLAALALVVFAWSTIGQTSQPKLRVVMISINHGDSILLQTSTGENALIDAGYPEAGTLKYLKEHNIHHLDLLIATHGHEDHIGGIPEVIRSVQVDRFIENGQVVPSTYFDEYEKALKETGLRRETVRTGGRINFGEFTFDVWNPSKVRPDTVNNNSIVLFLEAGKIRFLFTGDIEKPIEERLLNSNRDLHMDILKVAHHAGNTSSETAFLEAVKPTVAIYSASNFFPGFPDENIIDRLRLVGAKVYGTNFNGNITIDTDGKTYTVVPERGVPLLPFSVSD